MSNNTEKRLAQLKAAYESGLLDEDTYRTAVAGLAPASEQYDAEVSGSGSVAQKGGVTNSRLQQ